MTKAYFGYAHSEAVVVEPKLGITYTTGVIDLDFSEELPDRPPYNWRIVRSEVLKALPFSKAASTEPIPLPPPMMEFVMTRFQFDRCPVYVLREQRDKVERWHFADTENGAVASIRRFKS